MMHLHHRVYFAHFMPPQPRGLAGQENQAMAEELAALTPEFFEEIDRLRTNFEQAQAQLQRYGQRFGML